MGTLIAKGSLCTREPFLFTYDLSIFLTSTAFVDTNAKYGTPFEIYRILAKLSFRATLYSTPRCFSLSVSKYFWRVDIASHRYDRWL